MVLAVPNMMAEPSLTKPARYCIVECSSEKLKNLTYSGTKPFSIVFSALKNFNI